MILKTLSNYNIGGRTKHLKIILKLWLTAKVPTIFVPLFRQLGIALIPSLIYVHKVFLCQLVDRSKRKPESEDYTFKTIQQTQFIPFHMYSHVLVLCYFFRRNLPRLSRRTDSSHRLIAMSMTISKDTNTQQVAHVPRPSLYLVNEGIKCVYIF